MHIRGAMPQNAHEFLHTHKYARRAIDIKRCSHFPTLSLSLCLSLRFGLPLSAHTPTPPAVRAQPTHTQTHTRASKQRSPMTH